MGDRALVLFKNQDTVSPTVYLHWKGSDVPLFIFQLGKLMADRKNDVSYAAARFIGLAHETIPGNLSLGVMETPVELREAVLGNDVEVIADFSHGDFGVVVVDTATFSWRAYGRHLTH
ncbi:hypothetical protein QO034_20645 [Sedimentitalea sp. JM2-8]|uniref:Uncharacterized protein n=1 Tax=Sedimentitalea xiamensis TaxID=3050037 RepID=A0ABT7FK20_9RHOB|nr:hypothetical protein [Sedimentitalea xiamensis]MDK3075488.1 hypothetical protein [Sedimentitalea xiamensis]